MSGNTPKPQAPPPALPPRRRKKGGHGHHGGAWKIAYADMVTAMMAFFLVMWICGMDVKTRMGIADYFSNPSSTGGPNKPSSWFIIPSGGKPALSQGDLEESRERGGEPESEGVTRVTPDPHDNFRREDAERLAKVLRTVMDGSDDGKAMKPWVVIEVGDEGLRLEFIDEGSGRFFTPTTGDFTASGRALVESLAKAIGVAGLRMCFEGHFTPELPFSGNSRWHLGLDMAMSLHDIFAHRGLAARRVLEVSSPGWSAPRWEPAEDPRNVRVAVLIPYTTH